MEFSTYIEKTRETAVYPDDYERDYVVHGLVDEAGELVRTVKDVGGEVCCITDNSGSTVHVEQICKEMGDLMWYLARAVDHFDFEPADFFKVLENERKVKQDHMSFDTGKEKVEEALLLAAQINGHQKKSVRDDADKTDHIEMALRNILLNLRQAAHHFGLFDIRVVMERNIEKLFDRKARDVLHGDGDNR